METVLTRTRWAVLAVAPALLLGAACASTGGTAQAPPAPQAGEDTGATAPADTDELPAATEADAEEITAVTHTFVTGDNNGDAAMLGRALCTQSLTEVDLEGRGPSARPQILTGVDQIRMLDGPGGDEAMAQVSFTYVDDPEAEPTMLALAYLREDGAWTVCAR